MEQKFQRGEIVLLDMEKWREEKERRCNGVYFRNNSLLSLKETKKKSRLPFLSRVCMEMVEERIVEEIFKGQEPGWNPTKGQKSCSLKAQ